MSLRDFESAISKELDQWGVSWTKHHGGKHLAAVVACNGQTRKFWYPASPSDWRGLKNKIALMRRGLAAMGATRTYTRSPDVHRKTAGTW